MNKEMQEKIMQLQVLEQNLQNTLAQKQNFQTQATEITNALKDKVLKVIGTTMKSNDKNKIEKELSEKKEVLDLRIKNLEKQEKQLQERFEVLQSEVLKNIKK